MLNNIDLTKKPFNLKESDIAWVEEQLAQMSLDEKIGQLFCLIGMAEEEQQLVQLLAAFKPGGVMYRPMPGEQIQHIHRILQNNSKLPLLLAANLEDGGSGSAIDGTYFGKPLQVAATDDEEMAYKLGLVAGREGGAVGVNWSFAPIVDIDINFRNPITNVRTYGSDPQRVRKMAKAYMKGVHENGLAVSIKHFPGDGVDERDQHLLTSINSLSAEEWDDSFGMVYKELIEEGAQTVMVGHIMLPAYSKLLNPELKDEELMPATLSPEILQGLLREKLGFNGLIVTDASIMAGFTIAEKREIAVPKAIASGCDMFLFTKNIEEDYRFMLQGIEKGILTERRINEAVTRVLGLKASLKLHEKHEQNALVPPREALSIVSCEEHQEWAKACADLSVTLVKDRDRLLPIYPDEYKSILVYVLGDEGNHFSQSCSSLFVEKLRAEGFTIDLYDKANVDLTEMFMPIEVLKAKYDLVIYFSNITTASNQTVVRINWAPPFGSDMPWFIREIPTLFISTANPYHLQDVPRMSTFINGYSSNSFTVEAIIEKITGKSPFKGVNPVDPFCGYWEAKL